MNVVMDTKMGIVLKSAPDRDWEMEYLHNSETTASESNQGYKSEQIDSLLFEELELPLSHLDDAALELTLPRLFI